MLDQHVNQKTTLEYHLSKSKMSQLASYLIFAQINDILFETR